MRHQPAPIEPAQLWASVSEGRAPQAGEIDSFAAKIWRDAYRGDDPLDWQQVEIGSPPHRKSIAAALLALGAAA
jgi:hypothetical protein